jgi:uncharacterized SAM-binding protein YcdF (DUF218 family)
MEYENRSADLSVFMHERGWKSSIVVTSPFHSRRSLHDAAGCATSSSARHLPLVRPEWQAEMWWTRRGDTWVTIRELLSCNNCRRSQ